MSQLQSQQQLPQPLHCPESLYSQFTTILHHSESTNLPLYIELLPSDEYITLVSIPKVPKDEKENESQVYPPFLYAPGHLGMTKKTLMQLFLFARHQFFNSPDMIQIREVLSLYESSNTNISTYPITEEAITRLLTASFAMILWDVEQLTAVNIRRRVILFLERQRQQQVQQPQDDVESNPFIHKELLLLEGLLTSHLPKHVKGSHLWSYRRWLLFRYPSQSHFLPSLQKELTIVKLSSQIHPTNYYAWTHARLLTSYHLLHHTMNPTIFTSLTNPLPFSSLSDTSAWSFHLWITTFFLSLPLSHEMKSQIMKEIYKQILEIFSFLEKYTDAERGYESIWVFLRTLIAKMVDVQCGSCCSGVNSGHVGKIPQSEVGVEIEQVLETLEKWVAKEEEKEKERCYIDSSGVEGVADTERRNTRINRARNAKEWIRKRNTLWKEGKRRDFAGTVDRELTFSF